MFQQNAFSVSLVQGRIKVIATVEGSPTELQTDIDTYNDGFWHYITVTKEQRR